MRRIITGSLIAFSAAVIVSGNLLAKDAAPKKDGSKTLSKSSTSVSGTLAVSKDDQGNVTGVTITTRSGMVYNVDMAGFKQDCSELDGAEVNASGTLKDDNGTMNLTVKGNISKQKTKAEPKKKAGK